MGHHLHKSRFNHASIFHAALGEEDWSDVLKGLSDLLGVPTVFLAYTDLDEDCGYGLRQHQYDLSVFDSGPIAYADQWNPELNPFVIPILAAPVGMGFDRRTILSDEEFHEDPFARQAVLSQGIFHSRLANLSTVNAGVACLWVGQSKGRGPIQGDAMAAFDEMLPHFALALKTRGMIAKKDDEIVSLQRAIDEHHYGFLAVDKNLKIIAKNASAEAILMSDDGITESHRALKLDSGKDHARVESKVRALESGRFDFRDSALSIRRPSGLSPYRMTIAPIDGFQSALNASKAIATIKLNDPMLPKDLPDPRLLTLLHDLTPREAQVARLVALGLSKAQIGAELGVTENTIRKQTESAREKMGASNLQRLAFLLG